MRVRLLAGLVILGVTFCKPVHAHISVEQGGTHKSRYGDDSESIKEGPCGLAGGKRGTNVYTYRPGETITVKVAEYVPHPGYFRLAFDSDGDDDFKDPESIKPVDPNRGCPAKGLDPNASMRDRCDKADLYNTPAVLPDMDNLKPHVDPPADTVYTFTVKLPNVECDNCTLQVIQVMEDPIHGPYNATVSGLGDAPDVYHQCIDIVLKRGGSTAGSGAAAGTGGTGASSSSGNAGAQANAGTSGAQASAGSGGGQPLAGTGGGGGASVPTAGAASTQSPADSGGCALVAVHRNGTMPHLLGLTFISALFFGAKRRRRRVPRI